MLSLAQTLDAGLLNLLLMRQTWKMIAEDGDDWSSECAISFWRAA